MNLVEKDKFVIDVIDDLKKSVLAKVDQMPQDWDGHEIRVFIKDFYQQHYIIGTAMSGRRLKEYKNTCVISNLI